MAAVNIMNCQGKNTVPVESPDQLWHLDNQPWPYNNHLNFSIQSICKISSGNMKVDGGAQGLHMSLSLEAHGLPMRKVRVTYCLYGRSCFRVVDRDLSTHYLTFIFPKAFKWTFPYFSFMVFLGQLRVSSTWGFWFWLCISVYIFDINRINLLLNTLPNKIFNRNFSTWNIFFNWNTYNK